MKTKIGLSATRGLSTKELLEKRAVLVATVVSQRISLAGGSIMRQRRAAANANKYLLNGWSASSAIDKGSKCIYNEPLKATRN